VVKKIIFDQMDFPYPFVICVFANTCYVTQFLTLAMRRCTEKSGTPRRAQLSQPLVVTQQRKDRPDGIAESDAPEPEAGTQDFRIARAPQDGSLSPEPGRRGVRYPEALAALLVAPIWFAAQWTYAVGLRSTSVTSSTVISTTSCVTTFGFSLLFLGERASWNNVLGVLCCVGGNLLLLLEDKQGSSDAQEATLVGNLLSWFATLFYATYVILIKKLVKDPSAFFAFLGLFVALVGVPIAAAVEPAPLQRSVTDHRLMLLLLFTGLGDNVLSQYCWAKGVQLTPPPDMILTAYFQRSTTSL
jgi:solute carrier family 35 protein F5